MSEQNGDRARFQKDRKRKLRHRQRIQTYLTALRCRTDTGGARKRVAGTTDDAATGAASRMMHDEGGPLRTDD
jgi:hypothetical protein